MINIDYIDIGLDKDCEGCLCECFG